jgi:hypothetical protein
VAIVSFERRGELGVRTPVDAHYRHRRTQPIWSIAPTGASPIAGTYHGSNEVFDYFAARRDRAASTFKMHRRDVLTGDGARVAALTDGTASIGGTEHAWSTVGLYEMSQQLQLVACWLLPLDQAAFDSIWSR